MANTKAIILKIPQSLCDILDEIIEKTGQYANKPDFILTAVRLSIDEMWNEIGGSSGMMNPEIEQLDDENEIYNIALLSKRIEMYIQSGLNYFVEYKTELKAVAIHIPVGLIEVVKEILETYKINKSVQDFIKASIKYEVTRQGWMNSDFDKIKKSKEAIHICISRSETEFNMDRIRGYYDLRKL